jgi:outer membrane protein OmpA-like peptidoglycan-associated protein
MKKLCVLLALFSVNTFATENNISSKEFNQALNYYCGTGEIEFQEQVMVGKGKQILFHQGPFMQVTASLNSEVLKRTFNNELKKTDIAPQCREYLLTYAEVKEDKLNQKLLARVLFNFDQYTLTTRSQYILNQVTEQLEIQDEVILLNGHTDNKGKESYNIDLGLARSESVKAFLIEQGVSQETVEAYSFGEKNAVDDNGNAEGRYHNRRVDLEKKEMEK